MKDREQNRDRKDVIAASVLVVTFAGLLFGFYNGLRADMRDMRVEMRTEMRAMRMEMREELQAVHGSLADVRERLAVIETHIGIEPPRPAEQSPVENDVVEEGTVEEGVVEEGAVEQGGTVKVIRALVPASLAWLVDVYYARSVG